MRMHARTRTEVLQNNVFVCSFPKLLHSHGGANYAAFIIHSWRDTDDLMGLPLPRGSLHTGSQNNFSGSSIKQKSTLVGIKLLFYGEYLIMQIEKSKCVKNGASFI